MEQLRTPDGCRYEYEYTDSGVRIVSYHGQKSVLEIPDTIGGKPVTELYKKAFFNAKALRRIVVPESVNVIGDWAFAHCEELREIRLACGDYDLGKAIFQECGKLACIHLTDETTSEEDQRGFGSLLAAVCGILDAGYLFELQKINDPEWLKLWDARLLSILDTDDYEGYTNLLLCGEEDYGSKENDPAYFLMQKRKRKVRLAFLRLLYPKQLADANQEKLKTYLLEHTVGAESEESFLVLKEEHDEDKEYIRLFFDLGCITEENFDRALEITGEDHPQLKAYLLRYREESLGRQDFFAGLKL
ncbi:MAG: leucine-rich repeat domain-containing protein [Lachnospiraceae bacterium]|nr:leucine-rich repeat domain-containing protein [Lachnospiraceae bacterium]